MQVILVLLVQMLQVVMYVIQMDVHLVFHHIILYLYQQIQIIIQVMVHQITPSHVLNVQTIVYYVNKLM